MVEMRTAEVRDDEEIDETIMKEEEDTDDQNEDCQG